ncbi:MAG: hypothetical protein RLT30_07045, partial [Gammaproteobacteria bacterium]
DSDGGNVEIHAEDKVIISETSVITTASETGKGGKVQITGDKVGLTGETSIDASGDTGGGEVLVGGDFQGGNPDVQNASSTFVGSDVTMNAEAVTAGDAGKIIVWSDEATRFYGTGNASGGAESGDGGLIEVSGLEYLDFSGQIILGSVDGNGGTLLLDPDTITITDDATDNSPQTDIVFGGAGNTNITVGTLENTLAGSNAEILLQANISITVNDLTVGNIGDESIDLANDVSLRMETRNQAGDGAGGISFVDAGDSIIASGSGNITLVAGTDGADGGSLTTIGNLETDSGYILLRAADELGGVDGAGDIDLDGTITTNGGNVIAQASGNIVIDGIIDSSGGNIHLEANSRGVGNTGAGGADDDTGADSELTINAAITSGNGDITLIGEDDVIAATVDAGNGTINVAELGGSLNSNFGVGATADLVQTELDNLLTSGTLILGEATTAGLDGFGTSSEQVLATDVSIEGSVVSASTADLIIFRAQGAATLDPGVVKANAGFTIKDTFTFTANTNQDIQIEADAGTPDGVGTIDSTGSGTLIMDGGSLELIAGSGVGTTATPFLTTGVTDL